MIEDSSEVCHKPVEVKVGFSGVRKHTSFRCDSFLWKEFVKVCKNEGLSTCDCLEKLILGWLSGFKYGVAHSDVSSLTILTVNVCLLANSSASSSVVMFTADSIHIESLLGS